MGKIFWVCMALVCAGSLAFRFTHSEESGRSIPMVANSTDNDKIKDIGKTTRELQASLDKPFQYTSTTIHVNNFDLRFSTVDEAMHWVNRHIEYDYKRRDDPQISFIQSPNFSLKRKLGICCDQTMLLIAICRSQWKPDAYHPDFNFIVIHKLKKDGSIDYDGNTHAVMEYAGAYFDPTNDCRYTEKELRGRIIRVLKPEMAVYYYGQGES